jgi:dipeptidyl aminopeptidase/acylaminoacyl peptidase
VLRPSSAPLRLGVALLLAGLLAGCTVHRPDGDAPLRYRDAVFTDVVRTNDIQYGTAPDNAGNPVALRLDLFRPAGDTATNRPAVIWVHGGGFSVGDKASGGNFATFFAQLGYVTASINYRLLAPPGCGGDREPSDECRAAALAAQHDAQAAVRWFRANASTYGVDPGRIAMAGSSAGAVTSILAATRSEDPGTSGNPGPSSEIQTAVSVSGGLPTNETIDAGDAPTLFIHGTEDNTVFPDWAAQNAWAMLEVSVLGFFVPIEGAGHGLFPEHRDFIFEQTDYWLYHRLIEG